MAKMGVEWLQERYNPESFLTDLDFAKAKDIEVQNLRHNLIGLLEWMDGIKKLLSTSFEESKDEIVDMYISGCYTKKK